LVIDVPRWRLPEARTAKYFARMFPGSQPAGMVKQRPGDAARQVTPVYFFRMPLPDGFAGAAGLAPLAPGRQANQAACQADPLGRFLYVVYVPELERAGETIVLRRSQSLPSQRLGRVWP
jgi:hypothetical protein